MQENGYWKRFESTGAVGAYLDYNAQKERAAKRRLSMQTTTMGLVLRATKTGEADRVLSVLTPTGILSAIAKGSLRLKNRLHSATGLFCYSEFTLFEGKTMYVVDEAEVREVFWGVHEDVVNMALACIAPNLSPRFPPRATKRMPSCAFC